MTKYKIATPLSKYVFLAEQRMMVEVLAKAAGISGIPNSEWEITWAEILRDYWSLWEESSIERGQDE